MLLYKLLYISLFTLVIVTALRILIFLIFEYKLEYPEGLSEKDKKLIRFTIKLAEGAFIGFILFCGYYLVHIISSNPGHFPQTFDYVLITTLNMLTLGMLGLCRKYARAFKLGLIK